MHDLLSFTDYILVQTCKPLSEAFRINIVKIHVNRFPGFELVHTKRGAI